MVAASFSSELRKCASFCVSFHLLYSTQLENCTMKVSNEHCLSNFGGFIKCLGETTSSSDELILGSEGEYGSSIRLEFFFRLRLVSSVDVSRFVLVDCRSLSRAVWSSVRLPASLEDSSLSYCKPFLSLVLYVNSTSGSSLQLELLRLAVWYTVSMVSISPLPVSGVLAWVVAVVFC